MIYLYYLIILYYQDLFLKPNIGNFFIKILPYLTLSMLHLADLNLIKQLIYYLRIFQNLALV